jgi:hypothetical protein
LETFNSEASDKTQETEMLKILRGGLNYQAESFSSKQRIRHFHVNRKHLQLQIAGSCGGI